jgi:hypothetical protein
MLEQMRRQGASIFIYLIFGLLIVIFVLNFAPSRNRSDVGGGCSTSSNVVVAVDNTAANQTSFHVAYSGRARNYTSATSRQKVYLALDMLVRRELLAQEGDQLGIRTGGDLIDDEIKRGRWFVAGEAEDAHPIYFDDEFFDIKKWKAWVANLDYISTGSYRDEQTRGLQASLANDVLAGSVRVSHEEALADYLYENSTVTYDVVGFDAGRYRRALKITDADIKRFADTHAADVQARYKADERTYKGVKPELAIRQIFIPKALPEAAKPAPPPPPAPAAPGTDDKTKSADKTKPTDKKPAAGDTPKPVGLPIEAAKAKLEAVRANIAAGKLTFVDAENQLAADAADIAPATNGDRGWHKIDAPGLDEKPVDEAVKKLKAGELTPVIATDRGVYLVIATDKREGDLSFDQVKLEIAKDLARNLWGKEAAKRAALDALAKAQGGKPLDQLFEREQTKPNDGLEQLLNDPSIPEDQKQQLLQEYIRRMQQQRGAPAPTHGMLETHEQDVPVAWYADADGSSGSAKAGSAAPAAPAAPKSAPGSVAPVTGSAPAAGSAAPATAPAAPPAAAPVAITASSDVLPEIGTVSPAKVNRLGPTQRQLTMPGIGRSKDAIAALFDELSPGSLAKRVYEGDNDSYLVIQLIERPQADVKEFDKKADLEISRMRDARGKATVRDWLKFRCEALAKAGKIRPAPDKIRESDDKGNPAPTVYRPCGQTFDVLSR